MTVTDYKNDARYRELQLLSRINDERRVHVQYNRAASTYEDDKEMQMVLSLIIREMINGPDLRTAPYENHGLNSSRHNLHDFVNDIDSQTRLEKIKHIHNLVTGKQVQLELGHLGRLRFHELQDQLKATRLREPFGILLDSRHVERDLAIAIMNSGEKPPVSLAYLDMNGLKAFNEDGDHSIGDSAIKAFFHAVEKAVSGSGDTYRKGGDEVVVIMPGVPLEEALKHLNAALAFIGNETIKVKGEIRQLSSSCGLVSVNSPKANAEEEIRRADLLQKKAKEASKTGKGRVNTLFTENSDKNVFIS